MNKNLREQAATLCSALAAYRVTCLWWLPWADLAAALDTPNEACDLAWKALAACPRAEFKWFEGWALACSMLRNGEVES